MNKFIKVNIMIGRFQPFTLGHMKCVEYAWNELAIPTVIAIIDTPDEKADKKHPFPTSLILPIYEELFKNNFKIKDIILVKNADIVKIGEELYKKGYQIASWTCGTDRIESYTKMSSKYAEQAHLTEDFTMLEVPRSDEDISATKVRQALLDDDMKTFDKLTPYNSLKNKLKNTTNVIFDKLKKQINKIY